MWAVWKEAGWSVAPDSKDRHSLLSLRLEVGKLKRPFWMKLGVPPAPDEEAGRD